MKDGGEIYKVYCGKDIGTFFDWFSALFCYMSFVAMCGDANSTCVEQWGRPNGVGAVFGLNRIVKTLGILGPVIVLLIIFVAARTAIAGLPDFKAGLVVADSGKYELAQVGDGIPWASGASYGGFVILWFAAFLAKIGGQNNVKEENADMLLSTFAAAALCRVALIANIDTTWDVNRRSEWKSSLN